MIQFLRDVRLVPIVLFATVSLLALKTIGLVVDGRYTLGDLDQADITGSVPVAPMTAARTGNEGAAARAAKLSWAQQVLGYPETTGTVPEAKKPDTPPAPGGKSANKPEEPPKGTAGWKPVPIDPGRRPSPAEQALLERLQERRTELEARSKELEMRESLIRAAEKRVEGRVAELKDLEARVNSAANIKDEGDTTRFKNLVTMYENMKAKEAAKIFDRLDIKVLVEVATQLNPRRMSDIMAQMTPEAAERLTVELAARTKGKGGSEILPKIEGKPSAN